MDIIVSRHINKNKNKFYELIQDDIANDNIVYVIVPEQFTLGTEIEIFEKFNFKSTLNVRVKSFKTILDEVLYQKGGRALNFLTDRSKYVMIQMILISLKKELRVFQKNIYDKKFIELLISFIEYIEDNDLDISTLLDDNNFNNPELYKKLNDINLVIKELNKLRKLSDYTIKNKKRLAIDNISEMNEYRNISFYYDRFNDMSPYELEILLEIQKISHKTVLNLTLDSRLISNGYDINSIGDSDIFDISKKFYEKLYKKVNGNINIITDNNKDSLNEIEVLTDNMFNYDIDKIKKIFSDKKLKNIKISRSNNTSEEIENLAINIKKDIIDENYEYSDIAILCTNISEYSSKIKRNFKLNKIPFFIDEKRDLLDNPMVKFIKASIDLLITNMSTVSITQFLKASFFDFESRKINTFQKYIEKRKIRSKMIFDDKYFSEDILNSRYKEEDFEDFKIVNEIRNYFINLFDEDIKNNLIFNKRKRDFKEFTSLVYKFFANENILESISKYYSKTNEKYLDELILIWDSFIDSLDDLYSINIENNISFSDYCDILLSVIDNFKIGIIPPSQDNVIIGDIKRSRFNKVKKLYVIGMTNLFYPISNKTNDIFLEDEKNELIENGFELNTLQEYINSNDLLSFYTLLNSSEEKITFSYSLVDSSNESMLPSSILNWINVMIPKENILLSTDNYKDYIYSRTKLAKYLPNIVNKIKKGHQNNFSEVEYTYLSNILEAVKNNKNFTNINLALNLQNKNMSRPKLSKDIVSKIYKGSKFSVSQLESFNSNPYEHFIKYGIKPREDNTYDISRLDTGNVIHEFLSKFINDVYINKNYDFDNIFSETIDKTFEKYKIADKKNNFFISHMKEYAKTYSAIILKQLGNNINQIYFEEQYGDSKIFPAIKLNIDGEEYNIEGKIDRVDVFNYLGKTYFRVVDYKTGNKTFDIDKVYYGIDLQLMLYLRAAIESVKDGKPLGAFYQNLSKKIILQENKDSINIEKIIEIPKELKLNGLINDNKDLFEDLNFGDSSKASKSDIYSFRGNKYALLEKDNSIPEEMFFKLFKLNENKLKDTIKNILDGNISLSPYMLNGVTSYEYSNYKTIDKQEGLKYNYLSEISVDELFRILQENDDEQS